MDHTSLPYTRKSIASPKDGATTSQSTGADVNPLKFGGKELTTLFGRHEYDFSARMYAPLSARFSSPDRKAWDYPWLSPYCFCAADPINYIDPTGEDVIILLCTGTLCHLALMVEADNGKWLYYSINGDKAGTSSSSSGSSSGGKNDLAVEVSGLDELLGLMTLDGDSQEFNDKLNVNYEYAKAYIIYTTEEQDQTIRDFYANDSNIGKYDVIENNCATKVQQALKGAGVITNKKDTSSLTRFYINGQNVEVTPKNAYKALKSNPGREIKLKK